MLNRTLPCARFYTSIFYRCGVDWSCENMTLDIADLYARYLQMAVYHPQKKEEKFNKYIILIGLTAIYTRVLSQLIIILYLYDFIKIYTCRKVTIGVTRSSGSKDRHYSGQTKR